MNDNYIPKFPAGTTPLKSPATEANHTEPAIASDKQCSGARVPSTPNPWHKGEPPHDGTPYIAFGSILWEDDICAGVEPFTAVIRWTENPGELAGWHVRATDLTVAETLEDQVRIHYWLELPPEVQP